ncbi:hypothetical protein [Kribbella sp. NPDC023855]|uniref:hypothetical protein n=1 Tax=Kribbella sp. NPDC023855 TaxID=3154698 RepID=UPI00340603C2
MKLASSFPFVLAAAVSLTLTACGGDSPGSSASPSSTPSVIATPADSTPTETPTETGPVKRTKTELTKALLNLKDLPSGFSTETDGHTLAFSAPTSKCKTLVKHLNADEAQDSKASANSSFTAGQEGPYLDFRLDSMNTSKAVGKLLTSYREAVASCKKVTLRFNGQGSTSMDVVELQAPEFGDTPFAFKLTGVSGPKKGLEFATAVSGIGDVALTVAILAGQPGELDSATEAAVEKARIVLEKPAG